MDSEEFRVTWSARPRSRLTLRVTFLLPFALLSLVLVGRLGLCDGDRRQRGEQFLPANGQRLQLAQADVHRLHRLLKVCVSRCLESVDLKLRRRLAEFAQLLVQHP